MAVVKNKSTEQNRQFWEHVESLANRVRTEAQFSGAFRTVTGTTNPERDNDRPLPTNDAPHPEPRPRRS
jgi:hypothetical protein